MFLSRKHTNNIRTGSSEGLGWVVPGLGPSQGALRGGDVGAYFICGKANFIPKEKSSEFEIISLSP